MTSNRMTAGIVFIAAMVFLLLLSGAAAEQMPVVKLGDGAPIPYLEGHTSELVVDAQMLEGITGGVDLQWDTMENGKRFTIRVQNITVTDDVLAIFYLAQSESPLLLHFGPTPVGYKMAMPSLGFAQPYPRIISVFSEARPAMERQLQGLVVYSLAEPLRDGAEIVFQPTGENNEPLTPVPLRIDRSGATDPTRGLALGQQANFRYERYHDQMTDFEISFERLSFGPFGNRLLYTIKDKGRNSGELTAVMEDDQGNALPIRRMSNLTNTTASPRKPVMMHNEIWFLGGEDSAAVRLVPVQVKNQNAPSTILHVLPVDAPMPFTLEMKNGYRLTITDIQVDEQGFDVHYTADTGNGLDIRPGDAKGVPLKDEDFFTLNSEAYDLPGQTLIKRASWMAEHQGQPVSRNTQEDIQRFRTLVIGSYLEDHHIKLPELAVEIPAK